MIMRKIVSNMYERLLHKLRQLVSVKSNFSSLQTCEQLPPQPNLQNKNQIFCRLKDKLFAD